MAAAPKYKVYDNQGNYQGCAKDPVLAAVMADWLPAPSTVRIGHTKTDIVWTSSDDAIDLHKVELAVQEAETGPLANCLRKGLQMRLDPKEEALAALLLTHPLVLLVVVFICTA